MNIVDKEQFPHHHDLAETTAQRIYSCQSNPESSAELLEVLARSAALHIVISARGREQGVATLSAGFETIFYELLTTFTKELKERPR